MTVTPAEPQIEAVLFDMGGVLVQLAPLADVLAGADLAADEIWERWIISDAVRRFESGGCSVNEFADQLIAELGVNLDADEFIRRFTSFPKGLYPGAAEMVQTTASCVQVGVLSNTNALHWQEQIDATTIRGLFENRYLSFELGLLKPDVEIYRFAADDLGLAPEQVLFIDDNQINVDGARNAGMTAALAVGPKAATEALRARGIADSAG